MEQLDHRLRHFARFPVVAVIPLLDLAVWTDKGCAERVDNLRIFRLSHQSKEVADLRKVFGGGDRELPIERMFAVGLVVVNGCVMLQDCRSVMLRIEADTQEGGVRL